ncbi:hypothetical protein [Prosthecobacter sp.]|uniref:hypothetical protein n=1 Tax=Prosthecobacter sp. TaxID=1965333 RepID=UPI002ABB8428|nr:hypothetical protein [Prosthecobacter sp.]MDZ4405448.1 hypothetical protein [Prosthecobacter sp.]
MTRARWTLSVVTLLVFWLIGALIFVPRMQRDLEAAAQSTLAQQATLAQRLGRLHLAFDGQQAHLTGSVRTIQDRLTIEAAVRDLVSAPTPLTGCLGQRLNPVSAVINEVEVAPYPPGWLLLAATGIRARLLGTAANDYEARDLAHSVQESWSAKGGMAEGTPGTDGDNHDEVANVSTTLRGVPPPQPTAQAHLARIGQPWQEMSLSKTDEALLAEARTLGVSESEWRQNVLPVLRELRGTLKQQHLAEAESTRLAGLPPGHLFIAARDSQVILRGEVGSVTMKRAILDEALAVFAPRRVHDEIRVSPQRRPTGDFGPITTALLPSGKEKNARSFFLGLGGDAWKPVDWQIAAAEQSWKKELPAGLAPALLQHDSTTLTGWLQDDGTHTPAPSLQPEPAVITLALFGSKAVLAGQIAEESVRAQLIAAARQAYGPRILVLSDGVRVRGNCQPASNILHTLKSLPPPPSAGSAGVLAIATPGSTWTHISVTQELIEAGGLAKSTQLPAGIPAGLIEELSAEAIEQLRLHLSHLPISR